MEVGHQALFEGNRCLTEFQNQRNGFQTAGSVRNSLQEQTLHSCRAAEGQKANLRVQLPNDERRNLSTNEVHEWCSEKQVASLQRELSRVAASELRWRVDANRLKRDLAQLETCALARVNSTQCFGRVFERAWCSGPSFTAKGRCFFCICLRQLLAHNQLHFRIQALQVTRALRKERGRQNRVLALASSIDMWAMEDVTPKISYVRVNTSSVGRRN